MRARVLYRVHPGLAERASDLPGGQDLPDSVRPEATLKDTPQHPQEAHHQVRQSGVSWVT